MMLWLQRWNFIARARLERELWDAFERGEDLEALLERLRAGLADQGPDDRPASGRADSLGPLRLEVWQATLPRIRRIEAMMRRRDPPSGGS
jgi:hypothetical protein